MFGRDMKKKRKGISHFKTLNFVSLSIVLALVLIIQSCSFLTKNIVDDTKIFQGELKDSQWSIIETIIRENNKNAQKVANQTAKTIEDDLLQEYENDLETLKHDMFNNSSDNRFLEVLKDNLETKEEFKSFAGYMTGIVTNTDNYFSLDPSEGIERTWGDEIAIHYNKELAQDSINSFTVRSERLKETIRFWEKEPHTNPNHEIISNMSLVNMRDVFLKEGVNGLKNYTFFAVSYITPSGDIFGESDIDIQGNEVPNNKIFIAHTFNIYDILMKDYKHSIERIDKSILYSQQLANKQVDIIKFVSCTLLTIMIMIYCVICVYLRKKIMEIKNSYLNIKK